MFKSCLAVILLAACVLATPIRVNGGLGVVGEIDSAFNIRHHLGTKCPYWVVPTPTPSPVPQPTPPAMRMLQLNLVNRHGSRDPTAGDIDALNALAATTAAHADDITNPEYAWLRNWTNPIPLRDQGMLVKSGRQELYEIAQRMKQQYHPLLSAPYESYLYTFRSTQVPRTSESGAAYAYGLFEGSGDLPGGYVPVYFYTETGELDQELRFFANCPNYIDLKNNPATSVEYYKWQSTTGKAIAQRISERIGSYPNWVVSASEAELMWKACGFEVSIADDESHFCTLFSQDDALLMEYGRDIGAYWTKGYGHELNYAIGCQLLKNIIGMMEASIVATNVTSPEDGALPVLANLRFAHAETGLFKDKVPLYANYTTEQIRARKWRTSVFAPFAANVAFLLYKSAEEYYVKVAVNEVDYELPACGKLYCPFEEFVAAYKQYLPCPFCEMCFSASSEPCVCNVATQVAAQRAHVE